MGSAMTAAELSTAARGETLDRLERDRFDCVVIGGGISGAGVARAASQRGLRVALLEAEDYASGTSSRSTKLIHGGLRYLAMGDVALVRKTALERKEIFRMAPHLCERRWMIVPARSWTALLRIRAGVTAYEKLGAVEGEDLHRNWSADDLAREEPALDPARFKHACVYREYLTDDAHLVLANLRSAAALGAAVLNHVRVDAVLREGGVAAGVEAECRHSGRRLRVLAPCVINATGPWVEAVRRLEDPGAAPLLHLSKGVHVAVRAERLPVREMVLCEARDRRPVFVIRRGDVVYLGTTDTTYAPGADAWPVVEREDVEYLLEPVARHFRGEPLAPRDVVATWAGLRPLIAEAGKSPTEISRRDEVLVGPAGVVTLAGGKLTGYRPMAVETVQRAAEVCRLTLAPAPREEPPLPGGDFDGDLGRLEAELAHETHVPPRTLARLVRLYGTEARELVRMGSAPLLPGVPVLASEVEWGVHVLGAATLEDLLYRRLRTAWYVPEARDAAVEPAARRMGVLLGWSAARREAEIVQVRARLAADLAVLAD
jgi:glycerol-3-phosphate dehydrogenase